MKNFNKTNNPIESIRKLQNYCNNGAIHVMLESYYQLPGIALFEGYCYWIRTALESFIIRLISYIPDIDFNVIINTIIK